MDLSAYIHSYFLHVFNYYKYLKSFNGLTLIHRCTTSFCKINTSWISLSWISLCTWISLCASNKLSWTGFPITLELIELLSLRTTSITCPSLRTTCRPTSITCRAKSSGPCPRGTCQSCRSQTLCPLCPLCVDV